MERLARRLVPGTVWRDIGEFMRKGSFQLFSIGPDQTPGTEDDIHWGDF